MATFSDILQEHSGTVVTLSLENRFHVFLMYRQVRRRSQHSSKVDARREAILRRRVDLELRRQKYSTHNKKHTERGEKSVLFLLSSPS